eukprot:99097-Chlamydomonas_euryale.AAC.4
MPPPSEPPSGRCKGTGGSKRMPAQRVFAVMREEGERQSRRRGVARGGGGLAPFARRSITGAASAHAAASSRQWQQERAPARGRRCRRWRRRRRPWPTRDSLRTCSPRRLRRPRRRGGASAARGRARERALSQNGTSGKKTDALKKTPRSSPPAPLHRTRLAIAEGCQ